MSNQMRENREEMSREHVMIANQDRPMRSLSAEELFDAAMPHVALPVSMERLERLYQYEHGLRLVMDDTAYNYYSARYPRSPVQRIGFIR